MHNLKNNHTSPFKFLDAYDSEDKDMYFGRDEEIKELYERLFESNLVVLYGGSGTGKTSLIKCGLANEFESHEWLPILIRRESHLPSDARRLIWHQIPPEKRPENWEGIDYPDLLWQLYLSQFKPIYLVFDQFEELFIQGDADGEEARQFFNDIAYVLDREVQCKILFSIREEYFAQFSDFELLIPSLLSNKMRLEKMGPANLYEVIENTCAYFHIGMDNPEETIPAIINNLKDRRGEVELANLQIYLDKLYRNLTQEGKAVERLEFNQTLVKQTRHIEDVLTDFLEEQLSGLEFELERKQVAEKGVPIDILLELITEDGTKRMTTTESIKERLRKRKQIDPTIIEYCINRFVDFRLIKILGTEESEGDTKNLKVELYHDTLARRIFDKASQEEKLRLQLERLVRDRYLFFATKQGGYLSKDELNLVMTYVDLDGLEDVQRQYIQESNLEIEKTEREELDRLKKENDLLARQRKQQYYLISLIIGVAVILAGFGIYVFVQNAKLAGLTKELTNSFIEKSFSLSELDHRKENYPRALHTLQQIVVKNDVENDVKIRARDNKVKVLESWLISELPNLKRDSISNDLLLDTSFLPALYIFENQIEELSNIVSNISGPRQVPYLYQRGRKYFDLAVEFDRPGTLIDYVKDFSRLDSNYLLQPASQIYQARDYFINAENDLLTAICKRSCNFLKRRKWSLSGWINGGFIL